MSAPFRLDARWRNYPTAASSLFALTTAARNAIIIMGAHVVRMEQIERHSQTLWYSLYIFHQSWTLLYSDLYIYFILLSLIWPNLCFSQIIFQNALCTVYKIRLVVYAIYTCTYFRTKRHLTHVWYVMSNYV